MKVEISIENLESSLQEEQERLQEAELLQRDNQIDIETRRERTETLETQLYDGSMINARDLEALQREAASVRLLLEQDESDVAGAIDPGRGSQVAQWQSQSTARGNEGSLGKPAGAAQSAGRGITGRAGRIREATGTPCGQVRPRHSAKIRGRCESRRVDGPWPRWSGICARGAGCRCRPNCASASRVDARR